MRTGGFLWSSTSSQNGHWSKSGYSIAVMRRISSRVMKPHMPGLYHIVSAAGFCRNIVAYRIRRTNQDSEDGNRGHYSSAR
jgi:hypothetical protein